MADIDFQVQGSFTSTGVAKTLDIECGVDWIETFNFTQAATQANPGVGVKFYWQNGMNQGSAFEWKKTNSTDALNLVTISSGGFTVIDNSTYLGPPVTGTTITKANPAVCTANGHGFSNGDVVILSDLTNMPQLANVYFTIGSVSTNTFTLAHMNTNTANFTAETSFVVRKVLIPNPWYPIGSIQTAVSVSGSSLVATMSQDVTQAGYALSQEVRLIFPDGFGMTEANGLQGLITLVDTTNNQITISNLMDETGASVNPGSFSAFAWPSSSAYPNQLPQIIPFGAGNGVNNQLAPDSTYNNLINGIILGGGANGPAGQNNDVIYWRAGKAFSNS